MKHGLYLVFIQGALQKQVVLHLSRDDCNLVNQSALHQPAPGDAVPDQAHHVGPAADQCLG